MKVLLFCITLLTASAGFTQETLTPMQRIYTDVLEITQNILLADNCDLNQVEYSGETGCLENAFAEMSRGFQRMLTIAFDESSPYYHSEEFSDDLHERYTQWFMATEDMCDSNSEQRFVCFYNEMKTAMLLFQQMMDSRLIEPSINGVQPG